MVSFSIVELVKNQPICSAQFHFRLSRFILNCITTEIKSGKLKINDMQYAADDLHPYSAYLMAVPYIIIEVALGSLYYVRTRD